MALKMRHWVLLALAGCGLIAVTYLPPSKDLGIRRRGPIGTPEWRVLRAVKLELQKQQELLALYTARGQILEEVDRLSPQSSGEPILLFDAGLPDTWKTAIRGAVQIEWDAIQPVKSEFRFVLAVVVDTLMRAQGVSSSARLRRRHMFPVATDGHTCLAVLPLATGGIARDERVPPTYQPAYQNEYLGRNEYLGPCAWYLAFGAPGPKIEQWFLSHGYLLAYDSRWTGPESIRMAPYWANSFQEAACAYGRSSSCLTFMLDSLTVMDATQRRRALSQHGVTVASGLDGPRFSRATSSLLADLLRLKGRDRFRAFWTSDLDVEPAFAEAMGEPLGDWTAKWATRHLAAPRKSPRIQLASAAWAILIGGLAVVAGALSFTRREVR